MDQKCNKSGSTYVNGNNKCKERERRALRDYHDDDDGGYDDVYNYCTDRST